MQKLSHFVALGVAGALLAAPAVAQKNWLDVNDPSVTERPSIDTRRTDPPNLPRESIEAGEAGVVTVTMCVNAKGHVSDVEVTEPSEHKRLNDTTRRWLMKARMVPAKVDGKAVDVCGYVHQQSWTQATQREIRELEQQRGN